MYDTVFLHGLGQGPEAWQAVLRALPGLGADCPDLTPPGASGDYAQLLEAFVRRYALGERPLRLCGLSLGAVLALDFALRYPARVASLALIAPQYRAPKGLLRLQGLLFRCLPPGAFAGAGLSKAGMMRLTRSLGALDLQAGLPGLACPVLVLCGARDRANRPAAQRLAGLLPQGRLAYIPGAGHEVNRDAPAALARRLADFWGLGAGCAHQP